MKTTDTKKVPLDALRFAADVAMQPAAGDAGNVSVTITARSGKPISHWYWGNVVHDMAGMQATKGKIPLDYCHDPADVIGFAEGFDVSSGDLVVAGTLTPFREDDRAAEVIHKGQQGVPYEASIFFDPHEVVVENVGPGATVEVNGATFNGPGVVIRQWKLRGLAVCPYGADRSTSVEFGDNAVVLGPQVTVHTLSQEAPVPRTKKPVAKPAKSTKLSKSPSKKTAFADEEEKPDDDAGEQEEGDEKECDCEGEEDCDCDEQESTEASEDADNEDAGKQSAKTKRAPGLRFIDAFGELGAVWFAQGKSFEEAQVLFTKHLKEQNAKLTKDNAALRSKVKLAAGEEKPVGFSQPPAAGEKAAQLETKLGSKGVAAFAAGINVPGQD